MELLEAGVPYRAVVGFLAGTSFALIFRAARCFDISTPAIAVLFVYLIGQAGMPLWLAIPAFVGVLFILWRFILSALRRETTATLVMSVGVQTIVFSITMMAFGDRLVVIDSANNQIEGAVVWVALLAPLFLAAFAQATLRTSSATWAVRSVVDDPNLARAIGVPVGRVQLVAYLIGGVCALSAALVWATQTEIRTNISLTLILYGIAVGGWGRNLNLLSIALLSIALAFASALLSYAGGPLLADLSYVLAALLATFSIGSLRTRDED